LHSGPAASGVRRTADDPEDAPYTPECGLNVVDSQAATKACSISGRRDVRLCHIENRRKSYRSVELFFCLFPHLFCIRGQIGLITIKVSGITEAVDRSLIGALASCGQGNGTAQPDGRFSAVFTGDSPMRAALALTLVVAAAGLSACGSTIEQRAATGAVAGAVVAGPVGAAVGGAAGTAVGQAAKDD
jgi:osmotically inducible lipoprotein OsmB